MIHTRFIFAIAILLAYSSGALAVDPVNVIRGVNDRGHTGADHFFELFGDFPDHDASSAYVAAYCHGVRSVGSLTYRSRGQLNVAVPVRPSGVTCSFQLFVPERNRTSAESVPLAISNPEIEIHGVRDLGVTNGARWLELYGRFPDFGAMRAHATCGGRGAGVRIDYASVGQINVAFEPPPVLPTTCEVWVIRTSDSMASPRWGQRFGQAAAFPEEIGGYFWGGMQVPSAEPTSMLPRGQAALRSAGLVHTTRLVLSPRLVNEGYPNAYGIAPLLRQCAATGGFLACAVGSAPFQQAFAMPLLRTIVLTTFDGASLGETGWSGHFLDRTWLDANADRVRAEYRSMTLKLFQTRHGTGKRFIISNWESDNSLYCAAWDYAKNLKQFRAQCDALLGSTPTDRIAAMTAWFRLRQEGIRQGRQLAAQQGHSGVEVADAIEMASYRLLHRAGLGDTLRNIVPVVRPEYVTYSAWDSIEAGRLDEDLAEIKTILGGIPLIVGELGYKGMSDPSRPHLAWIAIESIKAARRAGVAAAIVWQAFPTIDHADSLLTGTGQETQMVADLREALAQDTSHIIPVHGVRVRGIVDRGVTGPAGKEQRAFELYGDFAGASGGVQRNYSAALQCDGGQGIAARVDYEGLHQINIFFAHREGVERWCVVHVRRNDGATSPTFGPRLLCPNRDGNPLSNSCGA